MEQKERNWREGDNNLKNRGKTIIMTVVAMALSSVRFKEQILSTLLTGAIGCCVLEWMTEHDPENTEDSQPVYDRHGVFRLLGT